MFFWNSLAFSMIQEMLAIYSLVPLPFLKPPLTSGILHFTYCWSLAWRILIITSMWKNVIWWRGFQSGVHGNLSSFEVFRGSTEFWFKFCLRINSLKLQLQITCSQKCYELNFNTLENVCANRHVFPLMSKKLKCEPS